MIVVADSSALIALAACDGVSLLDQIFTDVRVPPAVLRECTIAGKPHGEELENYLQGKVVEIDLSTFVIASVGLGQGELEAMALYKNLRADRLLLDDGRARKVAHLNGIEVVGSIGILLLVKERKLIANVQPGLQAIQEAGIHLSEDLVAAALRLAGEA